MYGDYRRGGSILGSFLLGGLIGAVLGLLFAPRSGAESREIIAEKANEYWGEAGEMYTTGKEKVGEVVTTTKDVAAEKSEALRVKIDEARGRLQETVAKSAEAAKGKVADSTPAVKDAVDAASGKAQDTLDFVAKKAAPAPVEEIGTVAPASQTGSLPQV